MGTFYINECDTIFRRVWNLGMTSDLDECFRILWHLEIQQGFCQIQRFEMDSIGPSTCCTISTSILRRFACNWLTKIAHRALWLPATTATIFRCSSGTKKYQFQRTNYVMLGFGSAAPNIIPKIDTCEC